MVYHYKQIYSDLCIFSVTGKRFLTIQFSHFFTFPVFPFVKPTLNRITTLKAEITQINTSLCLSQTGVSTTHHFTAMFTRHVIGILSLIYFHIYRVPNVQVTSLATQPHATLLPTWRELERKGCASATVSRTGKKE